MRKQYGSYAVGNGSETPSDDRRLPTGSLLLDAGMVGGLRVGWITSFYGEKSGGKSTTAIRCFGIAQGYCRNCFRPATDIQAVAPKADEDESAKDVASKRWSATGKCTCFAEKIYIPDPPAKETGETPKVHRARVEAWTQAMTENSYEEWVCTWIDMEHSFDKGWATKLGMDVRRLLYVRPESAEEALDIMAGLIGTVEVDGICVDSIAQLTPTKELTDSMEQWQQGLQARLVNKGIRKLVTGSSHVANSHRMVTQIWINQVRDKITMFGDPTVKPGGKGQEFAVHCEVKFGKSKVETIADQFGSKEDVLHVGTSERFNFKITKNRTGSSKDCDGWYTQRMRDNETGPAGVILEDEDIFKLALYHLVAQDKKAGTYKLADREYTSQKTMATDLRDDLPFRAAVRSALLAERIKGAR